jgi:transposase
VTRKISGGGAPVRAEIRSAASEGNAEPAAVGRNLGIDEEKSGKRGRRRGIVGMGERRLRECRLSSIYVIRKEGDDEFDGCSNCVQKRTLRLGFSARDIAGPT